MNALTEDHADGPRLAAAWSWPGDLLDEDDVRELAETWFQRRWTALAAHAESRRGRRAHARPTSRWSR